MRAYMRDQFDYFGIPTPVRRRVTKTLLKGAELDLRQVWLLPQREYAYCGLDWLDLNRVVPDPELLEWLITTRSWWDTVDALATHTAGRLVQAQPSQVAWLDRWSRADDFWLRRTALLYQLHYGQATDEERLFRYVDEMAHEKEFFIRKAIGWALRHYARTAPDAVRAFLAPRRAQLSGLSWREATKHL